MDNTAVLSTDRINAIELLAAFERYAPQIETLSLDCFDTILWRNTALPVDVFFDLQQQPLFKKLGFTANMRITAETNARINKALQIRSSEVTLNDIYQSAYPHLNGDELKALSECELSLEMKACYPFPPVIELMRLAHAKGKKIIIVSDTYLRQAQLARLLESTLPKDVMPMIDNIFCSCEHGRSKANGLLKLVSNDLKVSPLSILHIGDHPISDFASAKSAGIQALQLVHHHEKISHLLKWQTTAISFMDPAARYTRALTSPYRGVLASANLAADNPEQMIGYASIGPILYTFGKFICNEVEKLKKAGKKTKVLFLMRDAYLPSLVCEALAGAAIGKRVRISRFAGFAASFRSKEDVNRYLAEVINTNRFHDISRQLLLPVEISKPLVEAALCNPDPHDEFAKLITRDDVLNIIFKKSAEYRARMKRHLENEADIKKGDTLVFVDLGYSGTAQRQLEPVFAEEMGIDIVGLYLISLGVPGWASTRKGLLDPNTCDERTLRTLVAFIALLEQICTSNERSVVDYDDNGNAIFSDTSMGKSQFAKLDQLQKECLRFVVDAKHFFESSHTSISEQMDRDAAIAGLGRLLFIPTDVEVQYLQSFEFDLNLGTKDIFRMFDETEGLKSLRKRGLLFTHMEKNSKNMRTNYPAELRSAGIELTIALMAQYRYGFEMGVQDLSFRREHLKAIVIRDGAGSETSLEAISTHDGYFSLAIPVGNNNFNIGIMFGHHYRWVQFESAELIKKKAYLSTVEPQNSQDYWANLIFDKMEDKGGRLYECHSNTSLVMIAAANHRQNDDYVLRLVFRPLVLRTEAQTMNHPDISMTLTQADS